MRVPKQAVTWCIQMYHVMLFTDYFEGDENSYKSRSTVLGGGVFTRGKSFACRKRFNYTATENAVFYLRYI